MTATPTVWAHQANAHAASVVRAAMAAVFGAPYASFAGGAGSTTSGGAHGVIGVDDLKVSAHGTPNMSVDVDKGRCVIRGTEATAQGVYTACGNDAALNVVISTADATNARKDLIVAKVRDSQYSGANDDFSIVVVTGTPAASPADPTIPDNALVLARVAVAANATTIVSGNITDVRSRAAAVGAILVCTSSTRPSGSAARNGQAIYETDTDHFLIYDGTNWLPPDNVHGGTLGYNSSTSSSTSSPGAGSTHTVLSQTVTVGAGRRIRVSAAFDHCEGSASSGAWSVQLVESSTVLRNCDHNVNAATQPTSGVAPSVILTPSAGSHTYTLRFKNVFATGSFTVTGSSDSPIELLVEDIGT